jgi:hypothetical protein
MIDERIKRYCNEGRAVVRNVIEVAPKTATKERGTDHLVTSMTSFIGRGGPRF